MNEPRVNTSILSRLVRRSRWMAVARPCGRTVEVARRSRDLGSHARDRHRARLRGKHCNGVSFDRNNNNNDYLCTTQLSQSTQPLIGSSSLGSSVDGGGAVTSGFTSSPSALPSGASTSAAGKSVLPSSLAGSGAEAGVRASVCPDAVEAGGAAVCVRVEAVGVKVVIGSAAPGGRGSVVLRQLLWFTFEMSGTRARPRRYLQTDEIS